ncbi:MAG: hypothetical protein KAT04_00535 [Methylococcales bacterium]|nr:hypothetical protein [Methylococcales bacterium]
MEIFIPFFLFSKKELGKFEFKTLLPYKLYVIIFKILTSLYVVCFPKCIVFFIHKINNYHLHEVIFLMVSFNKLALVLLVSISTLATAPSVIAAGKVANQSQEEVVQSLDDTVTAAEAALAAIKNGTDKKETMALFKATKQTAKTIESSVVLAHRDRALNRVMKARSAYKKGDLKKAEELMTEAVERFIKVREKYHAF